MKISLPCHTQLSRAVRETINISRCIAVQQHEQRRGSFNKHNPTNATHMEMWEAEPRTYLWFYSSFSEFTWRLALSTLQSLTLSFSYPSKQKHLNDLKSNPHEFRWMSVRVHVHSHNSDATVINKQLLWQSVMVLPSKKSQDLLTIWKRMTASCDT